MDNDTISRLAAIDALIELTIQRDKWDDKEGFAQKRGFNASICAIEDLPSAERHGRWIENETSYADPPTKQTCNCSICGKASTRPLGDWCRWCGSRMDLDGDTE